MTISPTPPTNSSAATWRRPTLNWCCMWNSRSIRCPRILIIPGCRPNSRRCCRRSLPKHPLGSTGGGQPGSMRPSPPRIRRCVAPSSIPARGWVDVPTLSHAPLDEPGPLDSTSTTQNGVTRLRAGIPSGYLDWRDAARIAVPAVAGGVILDGRLPTGCGRRWRGGITRRRGWRATNRNSAARCLSARTMPASPLGMCCPMI